MRYLKRLLAGIYIYLGVFGLLCYISWFFTRDEPTALITAVFGAAGIESIVGAIIKLRELHVEKEKGGNKPSEGD